MKGYLFSPTKKKQYALFIGDFFFILLSLWLSYAIRYYFVYENALVSFIISRLSIWLSMVPIIHLFFLYLFNQYSLNRMINLFRASVMILLSVCFAGVMISCVLFFFPKYILGRQVFVIHLLIVSCLLIIWRLLAYIILMKRSTPKRLAVVGNGSIVSSFIERLSQLSNNGFDIRQVCISGGGLSDVCFLPDSLTKHQTLLDLIDLNDFDVLASDSTSGDFSNEEVQYLLQLKYKGKAVYDISTLYKNLTGRVPLQFVNGQWLLNNYGFQGEMSKPYIRIKRVFDLFLSAFLLLLLAPVMLLLTVIIKAEKKGNIIYRQERLGLARKPFVCYKFRTMSEDAEIKSGPVWATENDRRVTRLGSFLRQTRLDELPQLFNILKGEMSFVGPRPIREHFAVQMAEQVPFYWLRYDVKPGVTGWAQVNGRYAVPDGLGAFEYELFYIENMSIFLDMLTLLKTFQTVFWGKGK